MTQIEADQVEVQVGKMRLKTDFRNIERSKESELIKIKETETAAPAQRIFRPSPGIELHLRGMRAR